MITRDLFLLKVAILTKSLKRSTKTMDKHSLLFNSRVKIFPGLIFFGVGFTVFCSDANLEK